MSLFFDTVFGPPTQPVPGPYFLAAGCSHTSAVGVTKAQSWPEQLARMVDIKVCNLAEPAGNAWIASVRLARWFHCTGRPKFVVVQWPHAIRTTIWKNSLGTLVNVHDTNDLLFTTRLKYSDLNFYAEWMQAIITTNAICKAAGVPIVNWSLDIIDPHYLALLQTNGICLHGQTQQQRWIKDSLGSDGSHAGPLAHQQWAQHLQEILNATTT